VGLSGSVSALCTLVGRQDAVGIDQLFEPVACRLAGGSSGRGAVRRDRPFAVGCESGNQDTVRSIKG
jgi:hypothetical protein